MNKASMLWVCLGIMISANGYPQEFSINVLMANESREKLVDLVNQNSTLYIMTASQLWQIKKGIAAIPVFKDSVDSNSYTVISDDQKYLYCGFYKNFPIDIYTFDGRFVKEIKTEADIFDVSKNSKLLACDKVGAQIVLWDLNNIKIIRTYPAIHKKGITALKFNPDGSFIISGDVDGKVLIWDVQSDKVIECIGHENEISQIDFYSKNEYFITSSIDGTIKIWDYKGNIIKSLFLKSAVLNFALNISGKNIITCLKNHSIQIMDFSLLVQKEIQNIPSDECNVINFLNDKIILFSKKNTGKIGLLNIKTQKYLWLEIFKNGSWVLYSDEDGRFDFYRIRIEDIQIARKNNFLSDDKKKLILYTPNLLQLWINE